MSKFVPDRLAILNYWIEERETIRERKEKGRPPPWTSDPILHSFRFCNVHREDDKVTRWIKVSWRQSYCYNPHMVLAMAVARMVNWPYTLEILGFPTNGWTQSYKNHFVKTFYDLREKHIKAWTGAYMITAERDGTPKEESVAKSLDCIANFKSALKDKTCLYVWSRLQECPRVGSFIAAQIVADLKHTWVLNSAPDKDYFCAPGPGSVKGLNWLMGTPNASWSHGPFQATVNELREEVDEPMDAQDMQNCLCEIFKYQRGYSRTKYTPEK